MDPVLKSKPITDSSKSFRDGISDILAQADIDQPVNGLNPGVIS